GGYASAVHKVVGRFKFCKSLHNGSKTDLLPEFFKATAGSNASGKRLCPFLLYTRLQLVQNRRSTPCRIRHAQVLVAYAELVPTGVGSVRLRNPRQSVSIAPPLLPAAQGRICCPVLAVSTGR